LLVIPGLVRRSHYTLQWSSMLILLYFMEGVVRAATDSGLSAALGGVETLLAAVYFGCALAYLRPHKLAARRAKSGTSDTSTQ